MHLLTNLNPLEDGKNHKEITWALHINVTCITEELYNGHFRTTFCLHMIQRSSFLRGNNVLGWWTCFELVSLIQGVMLDNSNPLYSVFHPYSYIPIDSLIMQLHADIYRLMSHYFPMKQHYNCARHIATPLCMFLVNVYILLCFQWYNTYIASQWRCRHISEACSRWISVV